MRWLRGFVLGLVATAAVSPARAEQVALHSASYPYIGALLRGAEAKPVVVPADFRLPERAAARAPAVVVVHSIGGYREENEGWFAARLREAGFATVVYDSFAARGLGRVTQGGNRSLQPSALADAYAAVKFLAAQPAIDPARIAVIGFSFGGEVARISAFTAVRKALAPNLRIAAHVGFYPAWIFGTFGGPGAYTGAPVLLLFGGKDEITPPTKVDGYLAYLAKLNTGAPIETKTYPDAHHAWTNPRFATERFMPQHGNAKKCPMVLVGAERPRFLIGGEPREFDRGAWEKCRSDSRGYAMKYSAAVRAQSFADMLDFLRKHLGP
jgi:dienelactone hydrolase